MWKAMFYAIWLVANVAISSAFSMVSPFRVLSQCGSGSSTKSAKTIGTRSASTTTTTTTATTTAPTMKLFMGLVDDNGEEEEVVEPGKMRVSEIKAELDMRGIRYTDCFDKESLVTRLKDARATGKANPDIIDKFNKQMLEDRFKDEKLQVKEEDLKKVVANDGTLPGGMDPEMFQKLVGNPEVMALMQSPKLQDAMKLMMTGGQEELANAIKTDPELQQVVKQLDDVMKGLR